MLLPDSTAKLPNPRVIYRLYLQHLRLLRDPEVWRVLQPAFRKLLETPGPLVLQPYKGEPVDPVVAEETKARREAIREAKRVKALHNAREDYRQLRAAVACHPHALTRLIEKTYGQRGPVRWERLRKISEPWFTIFHGIVPTDPLPPPLLPLAPPPVPEGNRSPRARTVVPQRIIDAAEKAASERVWRLVKPPLIIPSLNSTAPVGKPPYSTPWKDLTDRQRAQVTVCNLRHIIGLRTEPSITALDLSPLSSHMRRIFPQKLVNTRIPEPPFPKPRPALTRNNPKTWDEPHILTPRLLRRVYERFWSDLKWVRPVGTPGSAENAKWERCSYDELIAWDMGDEDIEEIEEIEKGGSKLAKRRRKSKSFKKAAKDADEAYKLSALPAEHKWSVVGEEDLKWLDIPSSSKNDGEEHAEREGRRGDRNDFRRRSNE